MIKAILPLCLAILLLLTPAESYARRPVFPRAATSLKDITVRQLAPIAFGTFASYGSGGTITIDARSGARILSGSISTLSRGDYGQAEFIVFGPPGAEILISPPTSTVLNSASGGNIVLTDFKVSPSNTVTLDRRGSATIKIGASLKVPGVPAQGAYNGLFNITARYIR